MSAFTSAVLVALAHGVTLQIAPPPEAVAELVAQALKANPEVLAARQSVAESESHLAEMQGHRKLQLVLNADATASTGRVAQPPANESFATVDASLVAPIPNFARVGAEVAQAAALVEVSQAQFLRALLDIEFRTTAAAFELRRAEDAEAIAQQNLDQAVRQANDTQTRITHGDLPPADLLKAQVPVAQDRAALARAKSELRIARQNLNDLLQRDLNASVEVATPAPTGALAAGPADSVAEALRQNPDVREALATVRAAEANERIVRRGRDPDFALQLTHTRTGDPTAYAYLSTVGLSVSLPVSDGGVHRQQVRQARLQTDQARTALKLVRQRTTLSVEQAVLDLETSQANVTGTAQTEEIARQSLEKSRQAFAAGLTTTRDVLDAQLVYSQARIDANSARYDVAIAQAHLRQLLGAPPQ
ncbi:MAG: TolC family protein [Fimbriimonadaceae bacterium]